ncbi:MAG: hypothetical protein A4S12_08600 [Proteobacteria bacterium SG_bin5]|nr:MAG: hypothetical protein A4S12_08600 [Proteobacteria bacterium SG_bin5]
MDNSTTSSTSARTSSTSQILSSLGAGSGIDYAALVSGLVDAQFAAKNQQLTAKSDALTAQISSTGNLKSVIGQFAGSLKSLTKGGTLATQPSSANANVVRASALPFARLAGFSAQVEVRAVASAQASASPLIADRAAPLGTGTLTLTLGTATTANGAMTGFTANAGATPVTITIDATNNSLDGIAKAINAANAGVTANVVPDGNGFRLALKGRTGETQAFQLSSTDAGLDQLAVGVGSPATLGTAARDAEVVVDGLAFKRSTNTISDLIAGVRLDLVSAAPGSPVTLGNTPPTSALRQAVLDFVDTYNQVIGQIREQTDPQTGPLKADYAARDLQRALGALTQVPLWTSSTTGAPTTLAEIGVATNRDGTLTVKTEQLDRALRDQPQAVEAMFQDGATSTRGGLAAASQAIADRATSTVGGLGASQARYTASKTTLDKQQQKARDEAETMRTRLTRQFAGTDARISAYRSAQSFLSQQIDAWNGGNR